MASAPKDLQTNMDNLSWVASILPAVAYKPALAELQKADLAEARNRASKVDALQQQLENTTQQLARANASQDVVNSVRAKVAAVVRALEARHDQAAKVAAKDNDRQRISEVRSREKQRGEGQHRTCCRLHSLE
jgi:uncharacterized protein YigA (DUF484 family)